MVDYNVLILGNGFSGSLCAEILASAGHRVGILQKSRHPADTLSDPFGEIDLSGNLPMSRDTDNLHILEDASFVNASHYKEKWRVMLRGENGAQRGVVCDYLIDSTGRLARLARACGSRLERTSRLSRVFADMPIHAGREFGLKMERGDAGIWYCARISPTNAQFGVINDVSAIRDRSLKNPRNWMCALNVEAPDIQMHAARSEPPGLHLRPIHEQVTHPPCGPNWAATGSAARAFNPLSGHKRDFAEMSARTVAELADSELRGNDSAAFLRVDYTKAAANFHKTASPRWRESVN